jgi:DNA-directed RNA polymerase specialized sigma24 family protein
MESTVAQVSRYLDRAGVVEFSRKIDGLLMFAFQRALYRRVSKLKRLNTFEGTGELSHWAVDRTWTRQIHARLELERIVQLLSERSRTVLALRYAGYTWKESAKVLGASVSGLRSAFWRDIARVKSQLELSGSAKPEREAPQDSGTNSPRY